LNCRRNKAYRRPVRILFRSAMCEYMLKVSTIKKARQKGLKTKHPITNKIIVVHYSSTMVYWRKRTFVYVFVER
jgi:hypothetical protein